MYINNTGHMTKMAAMPINGKKLSKIFWTSFPAVVDRFQETWHEASMTPVLQCIYKS